MDFIVLYRVKYSQCFLNIYHFLIVFRAQLITLKVIPKLVTSRSLGVRTGMPAFDHVRHITIDFSKTEVILVNRNASLIR